MYLFFPFLCHLQTEDIIDDIIQYQTNSLSSSYKLDPFVGDFQIKQEPLHLTDQEKKERTKKDNHNQSEYRGELLRNALQFTVALINSRCPETPKGQIVDLWSRRI